MASSPTRTRHELRCFCARSPLLAVYGVEDGELFIHVKIYKQRRIFGEVVITAPARVKIHCRECFRWHKVILRNPYEAVLAENTDPLPRAVEAIG